MNNNILRSLLGLSLDIESELRPIQDKAHSLIQWHNVELDDGSLYNGFKEFVYWINPRQDFVESGLPAQIQIYCDIDENHIHVARLAKTCHEDDIDMDWDDLEDMSFSWDAVKDLLVKYQSATY